MISAGNDIVSFAETNPVRTTQPAFYKKFITDTEVAQYQTLPGKLIPFGHYIWLLWSVKEAAFKYLHRLDTRLVFSPSKFLVTRVSNPEKVEGLFDLGNNQTEAEYICRGRISASGTDLDFTSSLGAHYVHTVICEPASASKQYSGVKQIANGSAQNQSDAVRAFCLEQLHLIKFGAKFTITKSDHDVPSINDIDNGLTYPLSFSHHGQFVAYSFSI